MQLGFSHDINFDIPDKLKITVEKQTIIKISGSDKQEVGMIASKLNHLDHQNHIKEKVLKNKVNIY